ncbi:MAG: molybdenum ABC transporter ATP-binding protein [Caulobacteraceae bacterium]
MSDAPRLTVDIEQALGAFRLSAAFEAEGRGLTALFGPSGAGKSAILAAIAGATRPDRGRIALGSLTLFDLASGVNLPPEQRGVGWVFQDARLFPHLSVEANLRYGQRRAKGRPVTVAFDEVIEVLGIGHLLQRRPRHLSGGERQRVAMGRALLSQPRLLLMDEPLSALDAARKAEILPFLERLKTAFALPILYVSHSLTEVTRLADRVVVVEQGRVAAQGSLVDMLVREDIPSLAGRPDAVAALDMRILAHDEMRGLSRLAADSDLEFLVPRLAKPPGSPVRLLVRARDVLIALDAPGRISARNLLAATVEQVSRRADGAVLVVLGLGGDHRLLSAVTAEAARVLDLQPGLKVWAIVKSLAVEGAGSTAFEG